MSLNLSIVRNNNNDELRKHHLLYHSNINMNIIKILHLYMAKSVPII